MKHLFDKQNKYGIRKLSVGVCSAVIGLSFLASGTVEADQHETAIQPLAAEVPVVETESEAEEAPVASRSGETAPVEEAGERVVIYASTTTAPAATTPVPVDATQATASTQQADHPATHAVDGNVNTFWQSNPTGTGEQTLTVQLTEVATVGKITYTPRQVTAADPVAQGPEYHKNHHPGIVTRAKIDYSVDGTNWQPVTITGIDVPAADTSNTSRPVEGNTFMMGANNHSKGIRFTPVDGKFFRLTVLQSWGGARTGLGASGVANAAQFIPEGVKPTAPADTIGGNTGNQNQPQPTTPTSNIIKELSNETLTTQTGTKIALGDDVKNHLKTADSGTVYIEFRAPENNAILYTLFNATSGTNHNQYTALYSKSGQIGAEIRPGASIDLSDGTQRAKNGEWNAVALTYEKNPANDKNLVKIYVNGVLSTSREITEDVFKDITDLQHAQIGAAQRANGAVWGLNGLEVRNFKLFSNALTEAEIQERSAQFKREPKVLPTNPGEEVSDKVVIFQGGSNNQRHEGVHAFRIPALLKTLDGTLIAATDQRHSTSGDWGDIATVIKRSTDNGATWGETIKIVDLRNSDTGPASSDPMTIDPGLVQDPTTKRIFALYDMFPDEANASGMGGAFGLTYDRTPAHTIIDGKQYVNVFKRGETAAYTVRENGVIHTPSGEATTYRVNVNDKSVGYANLGDIYEGNGTTPVGNIYFRYDTNSPFRVMNQMFIWMSYSDDDGRTWSTPKDITTSVKRDYMSFLGVGPGAGIVLQHGPNKGRLVIPAYSANYQPNNSGLLYNGSQSMLIFYSDDHGETWKSGESVNDNRTLSNGTVIHSSTMSNALEQLTESTVVELKNGDLKVFMRGLTGKLAMATSKDGGLTFESDIVRFDDVNEVGVQLSAVRVERDGKEYVVLANAEGPGRANGHVRLAEVDAEGNLKWINHRQIEEGFFAYNSLQYLGNDEFGLIYESKVGAENDYTQRYRKFNWAFLTSPEPKLPDINVANVSFEGDNLAVLTFEESVLPTNNPSLLLSNGNTAQFVEQRDAKTLVYRIQPGDKDKTVLEVASGDISNVNGPKVNVVTKLGEESNLSKIDNKAIRATAGNTDAWQPGAGPDKLLDGNKASVAELKWDMPSNHVDGVYPEVWRLPQKVTVSTRDGQPIDIASMLITKRTQGNGTLTKYKLEAFKGDQKVHDSGEVAVDFTKAEVAHEFASPVNADRVVLTLLEAKQSATGAATPTMLTLREMALFGPRETTRDREVTETIPFTSVTREDPTKPSTYRETTPGKNGSVIKRIRETLVNGLIARTEEVGQGTRVEPTPEVTIVGTGTTTGGNGTGNTGNTGNTDGTGNTGQTTPTTPVKRERRETVQIPFDLEIMTDANLPIGQIREVGGRNGSVDRIYEDTYVGDMRTVIGTQVIREENHVAPVKKVIYVGTQSTGTTTTPTTPTPTATTRPATETVSVPFDTLTYSDPSLPLGHQETVREGVNGSMIKVYEETVVNGQVVSRRLVDINSVVPATAKLVRRGTGSAPTTPTTTTTTVRREVLENLPFSTETLNDSNLAAGTQVVAREGVNGRVTKVYEDTYTNGVKTGERLVEEIGRVAPINKVILLGTRPNQPVTPTVTTDRRSVSEVVPFETKRIEDANLELGKEVVIQEGQNGSLIKVYEDTLSNGVKTGERLVEVKNISQPVTKLIHVGTRPRTAITTQTRQVPETIPFETKRIDDANLEAGKEVVLQEGQAGLLVKVYEDTYTNGVKTGERVVEVHEVTLPVTKIIRVGRRVVGKVTTQTREVPEAVAFDTQRVEDPSLEVGKEVVTQEGKAGQVVKVYEDTYTDGVKTSERLIDVREVSQPVTKIVRFGSRPATTVTTKTREVPEVIAFDTQRVEDPSLEVGKEVIAQEGKVGQVVKVYEDTYTNGVKTGERLIDVREAELPVTRIILVGTKVVTPEVPTKPEDPTGISLVAPVVTEDKPFFDVNEDHDGDGFTSKEELDANTNPLDKASFPVKPTTPVGPTKSEEPTALVKLTEAKAPVQVAPTAAAPAAATPAAPVATSQPSLPETGDASSALTALGAASLMASLGLVGLKKKD